MRSAQGFDFASTSALLRSWLKMSKLTRSCLSCVRNSLRPTLSNSLSRPLQALPSPRHLHAFAPTPSRTLPRPSLLPVQELNLTHAVLKKRSHNAAAAEEAFDEEFEEDLIEEEDDLADPLPSSPSDTLTRPERRLRDWNSANRRITSLVAQSQFALRSSLPSPRLLASLIRVADPSRLEPSIDLLAAWRRKNLPVPHAVLGLLLDRLEFAKLPLRALDILKDRTTYGLEIEEVREADYLFFALAKKTEGLEGEEEKRALLEAPHTLRALVALSCPADKADPVGLITALSIAVQGSDKNVARVAALEKELKALGGDKLSAFIAGMPESRKRGALRRLLRGIVRQSEGEKGLVEMLAKVADGIQLPLHMTTPFVPRAERVAEQ